MTVPQRLNALAAELANPRRKFRLEEMRLLAAGLGNPQTSFPSVLIAGTNGKGSTAATLAAILQAAGYRTGLYTSPHLQSIHERIAIDGEPIGDTALEAAFERVDAAARRLIEEGKLAAMPSFFEAVTAMAFLHFADCKIDIAVLEVGMGGRLDATNIVEPLVSVITDIALDHMEYLGNTVGAIAREKAGILRANGVLVTLPQHPEANNALGEVAMELGVRGVNAAEYMPGFEDSRGGRSSLAGAGNDYRLTVLGEEIAVRSPLAGVHQQRNLALAIAAAAELSIHHGYTITPDRIAAGIAATRWPGRLEFFAAPGAAAVLLDVAHNPAGAWALRAALSGLDPAREPRTVVFSCLRDKAAAEIAQILFPLFDRVLLTEIPSPRAASLEDLRGAAATTGAHTEAIAAPKDALARAREMTPATGLIVITGSVYLVGELRSVLLDELQPELRPEAARA